MTAGDRRTCDEQKNLSGNEEGGDGDAGYMKMLMRRNGRWTSDFIGVGETREIGSPEIHCTAGSRSARD